MRQSGRMNTHFASAAEKRTSYPQKKKQHTIPICYLENFTDDKGSLHVLDLQKDKTFTTKPRNVLTDNHFYTIKFYEGGGSFVVENTLERIESEYASVFQKKIKVEKPLERLERGLISVFVAAMLLRTKAFRNNLENTFREIEDFIKKFENLSEKEKEDLASMPRPSRSGPAITGEEFKKIAKDVSSFHSLSIVDMLREVSNIIYKMKWGFLLSDRKEDYFITSDNPCVLINIPAIKKYGINAIGSSPGLCQDEVELSLPLSSQISLLAGWKLKQEVYSPVPSRIIDQINIRVMMYAKEKAIAKSNEKLLEVFSKLKKP